MPTFHKFKLLIAAQCAVARSPTASPVIHLRRKRTLRMLLGGKRLPDEGTPDAHNRGEGTSPEKSGGDDQLSARNKLKDLFVSSPPAFGDQRASENVRDRLLTARTASDGGVRGAACRSLRPLSATFRQRLMRRAWRPVLLAIPE
ncbi:uncharacterized protein [Henckelia pumila]|uniref:uncharacterized protein n=1 Tax=Henckelia pumila TaxID=405737 RepID=UPI003C6DC7A6